MKKYTTILLVVLILGSLIYWYRGSGGGGGKTRAISGLSEPVQEKLTSKDESGTHLSMDGWEMDVTYEYKYEVDALVISAKSYSAGGIESDLAPKDIAFAWGTVAELNEEVDFNWSQSNRWCNWHIYTDEELAKVGGVSAVDRQSSNNHIIPANDAVKKNLKKVKKGDHLKLKGYLVSINGTKSDKTFYWNSSTTREDSGDGACEVIYTTSIEWLP